MYHLSNQNVLTVTPSINYCTFIDSFNALVAYNEQNLNVYCIFLQHTKGLIRNLVQCFQYFPGPEAYDTAKSLFKDIFW